MAWIELFIAGIFRGRLVDLHEILKRLHEPEIYNLHIRGMAVSFYFLAMAVKKLPMGTAYGVWTGVGALGAVAVGIVLFKEPVTFRASSSSRCS